MFSKIKRLYIEQFKGFRNFDVEINENTTILVGGNGTGKTTILEVIYNILSGNEKYFLDTSNFTSVELELNNKSRIKFIRNDDEIYKYINNKKIESNDEFFTKQKVIYFPAEITFKNYEVTGANKLEITDSDVILNAEKMSKELKQFLVNQKYQDLNDIANGNPQNAKRIEKYKRIYNEFLNDKKFIGIDNETFEPIFELDNTQEHITIEKLSSGEQQIFYKGGSLVQYGEEKEIIVLIDEPETSMHPEWQQKILSFYKSINPKAQYIFATHSPHIVSSSKKEEIRVILKENNKLAVDKDIVNTYGLTNEEILFKIFNLNSVRDIEIQKEINEYKSLFSKGDLLTEEEKEKMEKLKEKLKKSAGLSKSDIAMLDFESTTNRFREMFKKLGDI